MTLPVFKDILGNKLKEGDPVVFTVGKQTSPQLFVGQIDDITEKRVRVLYRDRYTQKPKYTSIHPDYKILKLKPTGKEERKEDEVSFRHRDGWSP